MDDLFPMWGSFRPSVFMFYVRIEQKNKYSDIDGPT